MKGEKAMEQKDKWRDTGKDVRKMITAQIVSFLMTAAGTIRRNRRAYELE